MYVLPNFWNHCWIHCWNHSCDNGFCNGYSTHHYSFSFLFLNDLAFVSSYSLDVEGSEFPGTWEDILNYLDAQGYEFHFEIKGLDAVFVKKGFMDEL